MSFISKSEYGSLILMGEHGLNGENGPTLMCNNLLQRRGYTCRGVARWVGLGGHSPFLNLAG